MRWDDSEFDVQRPTGRLGFWEKDLRSGLVQWSSDVDDILGIGPGCPSLERLLAPVPTAEREGVSEALRRSIDQRFEHHQVEYRCLRSDGTEILVRNEWGVECGPDGAPTLVRGVIQDVTYRKETKVALHRQTALLGLLYEIAKCANEAETVDQALRAALGHVCNFGGWPFGHVYAVPGTSEQIVPTAVCYEADPQRFEAVSAARARVRHAFVEAPVTQPRWWPDVRWLWPPEVARAAHAAGLRGALDLPVVVGSRAVALIQCFATTEQAPEPELLTAMAHVAAQLGRVFERKRGEDALRESEARLRQILEGMPVAVFVVDRDGKHHFHNEQAAALLRHGSGKRGERGGDPGCADVEVLVAGTDEPYPPERNPIERALRGERVVIDDAEIRGQGRHTPIEAWGAPIFDESGRVAYALAAFHDISERRKVERMKDEFVSVVSHELRTPLTSLQGALGLLEHGVLGSLPNDALEMVRIANESCQRLRRLVDELLDVQKLECERVPLPSEPIALGPILERAVKTERPGAAAAGVNLALRDDARDALVLADRDRLLQVAVNLLSNAIRYSPRGTEVRIEVTRREGRAHVGVVDRGPGVPEEFRGRLFQKFSQADASDARHKTGTGLGLSICKTIIANLGGTIGYEPTEGGGATFFFELPDQRRRP